MADLPGAIGDEVERLADEAGDLEHRGDPAAVLARYEAAWALFPEPRYTWDEAFWLLREIGSFQFRLKRFADGRRTLMEALKHVPGALEDAQYRMRVGQCLFELGEKGAAADWLATAFLLGGTAVYIHEDPKYINFIKQL